MFLLSWLPDGLLVFFVHGVFLLGLIGLLVGLMSSKIPFLATRGLLIQIVSIFVLVLGIFLEGVLYSEMNCREKVESYKKQIQELEVKSKQVNTKIVEKIVTKKEIVEVIRDNNIEKIKTVSNDLNKQCNIDNNVIKILNSSAKNEK
jgi:energy-coupling factor transporter transmembrane protein EcfT